MFRLRNLSSFRLDRKLICGVLTLLNVLMFSIIIIVDIIAFFQERDLTFLIILTLLSGSLSAYSQAWYFGSSNVKKESSFVKRINNLKPEVRILSKPTNQMELEEEASREMEEKEYGD